MFHDGAVLLRGLDPGSGDVDIPSIDVVIPEYLRNNFSGDPGLVIVILPMYFKFAALLYLLPACDSANDQYGVFVQVNRLHIDSGGTDLFQFSLGDPLGHYTWLL